MRFRPEQHVRRQYDFRDAREKGRRLDCGGFTLWYYQRPAAPTTPLEPSLAAQVAHESRPIVGPRVGVIASTAAVGCAVERNRAKRRLREVFRHQQQLVPTDYDLLMVARHSLNGLEYTAIEKKFIDACRRLFPANA
ncbi:ribonuclease P protein component [Nibricoccus aquaticus]|uniref:Ribonuclease P protein component n=1 Tax=Nibricoccus aquaticus TaxID=2576891 RepID=A0A290QIS6_9BACT|nr:ribonuclease P protein component [Nibricoccus aquaticus]ATC63782.1 ribonuclease P protein component [Nibricoccus aquaticus]